MDVRFNVLGTLRVHPGHGPAVTLKPSRPATLLAALLLRPNETVSSEYLDAVTWGSYVPRTARASLHTYISRLRQMLCRVGMDAGVVETVPGGYRIEVGPGELDLLRFHELVEMARTCDAEEDERALLAAALDLFTGDELLVNVTSAKLRTDLAQIVGESWRHAAERCFDLRLASDPPSRVRHDLRAAVRAHPDHPRFGEQLVEVLWREGDVSEALRMFAQVRAHYRDVLATQPPAAFLALGEQLRAAGPLRPARDADRRGGDRAVGLIGRDAEIAEISERLAGERSAVMITGLPGAGKTALALQVARRLDRGFRADTELIALSDDSGAARCPDAVTEEIAAALRVRREPTAVLVLDGVVSSCQVLPVLQQIPGRVILTGRRSAAELAVTAGVSMFRLGGLEPAEARSLLGGVLGRARAEAEPEAVERLATWCGYLPLPMRIAAVRLAMRPRQSIDEYARAVAADPAGKLSAGSGHDLAYVQRAEAFLDQLEPGLVRAFGALARLRADELTQAQCLAALADTAVDAEQLLELLNEWNLVEELRCDVFRIDPLMRAFVLARPAQVVGDEAGPAGVADLAAWA